jgi:hypothetical protein
MSVAAAVVLGARALNSDGDLGRHLRVGREILAHGLFFTDRFSWTMAGTPFVPYEWGSEVLYALAHSAAGLPGVLVLMAVVIAAAYFCLNLLLQQLGMDPLLAFGTSLVAGVAGSIHWLARPHVFSLVAVVGVMALLEVTSRQSRAAKPATRDPRLLVTLLLFALWANLHGGFLLGLILICFYVVGDAIAMLLERHRRDHAQALKRHLLILCAALVGMSLNPVGPRLLTHLTGWLGNSWLVNMTNEYRSPDFHALYGRLFLVLLLLVLAAVALVRRRMSWPHLIVLLGTTAFALHSARNIPLWALTGFPLAILHADQAWRRFSWPPLNRFREILSAGTAVSRVGPLSGAVTLALVLLALNGGRLLDTQLLQDQFDSTVFPVEVVARARAAHVEARIFNEFIWGGYILDAWPEQRVFIDGQTDIYGVAVFKLYMSLRNAAPGWEKRLDSLGISEVLLPTKAPLAHWLMASPGWTMADSVGGAVRFARSPSFVPCQQMARSRPSRRPH